MIPPTNADASSSPDWALVSPLGDCPTALWEAHWSAGRSGVDYSVAVAPVGRPRHRSAARPASLLAPSTTSVELNKSLKKTIRKALKVMCRETMMAVSAAQQAVADAGYAEAPMDPESSGVVFGSDYMLSPPEDFTDGMVKCGVRDEEVSLSRMGTGRTARNESAVDAQVSAQYAWQPHRDFQRSARPEQLAHLARSLRRDGRSRSRANDRAWSCRPHDRRCHGYADSFVQDGPCSADRAVGRSQLRTGKSFAALSTPIAREW